jgi:membrane protease YdiL (CAAX protease family)
VTQILAAAAALSIRKKQDAGLSLDSYLKTLDSDGLLLSISTWASTLICTALLILFIRFRKNITLREYLHLVPVSRPVLMRWLGLALLLAVLYDLISFIMGRPLVPDYMVKVYQNPGNLIWLWSAIVLAAPLFEEVFFRGFLLEGIRNTKLGALGAALLTSLLWTIIHLQYGTYELAHIFILGVFLALARLRTSSLYTALAIHVFLNFYATCEVALLTGRNT